MKTSLVMLLGAGVLSFAMGVGAATPARAAINHHHRHMSSQPVETPTMPAESNLTTIGNNPAKRYATRHAPQGATSASTLMTSGNNPAKSYVGRHAPEGAVTDQTLLPNGNNPARKAASAH